MTTRRVLLVLGILAAPAWAGKKDKPKEEGADVTKGDASKIDALKVNMWGDVDDFETTKPAVKVIDRVAHLDVWVNHQEGGTVSIKRKRQDTGWGKVKVKDTYLVQPTWPSPETKEHTVKVRFAHVGYRGARIPQTGTMTFKFKRAAGK